MSSSDNNLAVPSDNPFSDSLSAIRTLQAHGVATMGEPYARCGNPECSCFDVVNAAAQHLRIATPELAGLSSQEPAVSAEDETRNEAWRRENLVGGFPVEPPPGSPEAVAQAAETIRTVPRYSGVHIADPRGPLVHHEDFLALEEEAERMREQRDELADALEALLRAIYQTPARERLAAHVNARCLAEAALRKAGRA